MNEEVRETAIADKSLLLAKYSKMSDEDLKKEKDFWLERNAGWERILTLADRYTLTGGVDTVRNAIAINQETIELIDSVLEERRS